MKVEAQPRKVDGLPENSVVSQIEGGLHHSVAVLSDGTVFSWGESRQGQLGYSRDNKTRGEKRLMGGCAVDASTVVPSPQRIFRLDQFQVVQVACGDFHTLVLTSDWEIWSFGLGTCGRLGHGDIKFGETCGAQNDHHYV